MSFAAGTLDGSGTYDGGISFDHVQGPPPVWSPPPSAPPPPVFSATTMRLYGRFPEVYRVADATAGQPPNDYPLLRWVSLVADQAAVVETLLDRFSYTPVFAGGVPGDTSDLVDPSTADPGWLAWLSQLVGVPFDPTASVAAQRAAIIGAPTGRQAGSRASIIAVAQAQLTGAKFVQLIDHADGTEWGMQIITRPSESPSPDTLVQSIIRANVKPAGVILTHLFYQASWASIESTWPTWHGWETATTIDPLYLPGSWGAIEETPVPSAAGAAWSSIESTYPTWATWETAGSWGGVGAG